MDEGMNEGSICGRQVVIHAVIVVPFFGSFWEGSFHPEVREKVSDLDGFESRSFN